MDDKIFDVIVDTKIARVRENAKAGNSDSMIALAGFILQGKYSRRDDERALKIIDRVLARREKVPFPDTIWNALGWKTYLVDDDTKENLMIELIRDMTQHRVEEWNFSQILNCVHWLNERQADRHSDSE